MDRTIVYPGSIPLDTDLLQLNRNTMVALGALMKAVLGTATVVDGLVVSPTTPNSLSVSVGPGSITAFAVVDATPFGSLPADGDGLVKMGVNLEPHHADPVGADRRRAERGLSDRGGVRRDRHQSGRAALLQREQSGAALVGTGQCRHGAADVAGAAGAAARRFPAWPRRPAARCRRPSMPAGWDSPW